MSATRAERSSLPTGRTSSRSARWLDPDALMRIKDLQLRARAVVEGFLSGLHRSPYHGFSVEFTEYRQYSPGDDLRYLDWRLYARSDRYYIKRFEDETNLRCQLLVDMSRSMSYGSRGYSKAEYARTAAATLAYFLALQRDAVGVMTFDEAIVEYLPARYRPGHMHRIMLCLERREGGQSTNLALPVEQVAKLLNKRGMIVLISDLLAPLETLESSLGYLRTRGHDVVLLRILDPAEVEFTFEQAAMFEDLESGRQLYVDAAEAKQDYLRRFREHSEQIRRQCGSLGIELLTLLTDQPLELSLFQFVQHRQRRGRQSKGTRAMGPATRGAAG